MKNATFRQLRIFVEVARCESFSKAAAALHLTPPAVTMQIKELESQLGMPLFDRQGRQVTLSTVGEYMLVYARKILSTLKDAEDAAARLQRLESGRLNVGMVSTAGYFLPGLLAEFNKLHPGVDVRLLVGNREMLVKMLQFNEVDIAVMGRPPSDMSTRTEPFSVHPHVFVCAPDHPLLKQGVLSPQVLRDHPMITRETGSGTRGALDEFSRAAGVAPTIKMELWGNEIIKQAVMAGMGLSFLSLHTIGPELDLQRIAILPIQGAPVMRGWNCVHTLAKVLSPAAQALRHYVLENGQAYLARRFASHVPHGPGHLLPAPAV